MSSLVFRITGDPSAFKAAMGEVSGSLDTAGRKAEELSGKLNSFGNKLSIGITAPVIALGASVVKTAVDMDSLKRGLTAVAGSSEEAERQLKRLQEVAKLPGLGFKDAVEGSIRLQAAGFNAQLAERSLKAFGNALATVGKGKAELDGVTLALSQIASKGKISAEEINQLAERVPQIRQLMKAAFGTADTEVLQKAGIQWEEFITRIVTQAEKLKQVTGGPKNAMENFSDAVQKSATRIGEHLLPSLEKMLPRLEKVTEIAADAVDGFTRLPAPIQETAIAIGVLAVAAGPVSKLAAAFLELRTAIVAVSTVGAISGMARGGVAAADPFIRKTTEAMQKLAPAAVSAAGGVSALGAASAAAGGAAVGGFLHFLNTSPTALENQKKAADESADGMKRLNDRYQSVGIMGDWLRGTLKAQADQLGKTGTATRDVTKELAAASKETAKAAVEAYKHSFAGLAEAESTHRAESALKAASVAWLDYTTMHELGGKKMVETRSQLEWLTEAVSKYQQQIKQGIIMNLPEPVGMPKLPSVWTQSDEAREAARKLGIETESERAKRIEDLRRNADVLREANRRGDPNVSGNVVIEAEEKLRKAINETGVAAKRSGEQQSMAVKQVSLVLTDLSRGITDVIFKGGKFGDMMKGVATEAAKSITRILIEGALMKLGKTLLGIGSTSTSVFGGISKAIGGLFGSGSKGGSPIFSVAGGASDLGAAAVSSGSSAGSVAGSVASAGITGVVGAVAGVASAVSGIIGNFQMHGMNKTLDLIEKSTRYAEAYQLSILEKTNEFLPKLADIHQRLIEFRTLGVKLEAGGSLAMAGGGEVFYFDFSGANLNGQSQQSIEKMLEAAITRLKQKGLSK